MRKAVPAAAFVLALILTAFPQGLKRVPDPDTVRQFGRYADQLIKDGKYAEAVTALSDGIAAYPKEAALIELRAWCYSKLSKYEESAADYTTLIGLRPREYRFLLSRGAVYSLLKRYEAAFEDLERFVAFEPKNVVGHYHLSHVQLIACRRVG